MFAGDMILKVCGMRRGTSVFTHSLAFWHIFSVYVQLWLFFTVLFFILKMHYMFRPNWQSSDELFLQISSYKESATAEGIRSYN
jgi:hypothetical protein